MTTTIESTITFPYKRSLGPVVGAFMTALTERRILGIRNGEACSCPRMEWDPAPVPSLAHDFVEVGPAGTVEIVDLGAPPTEQHPLSAPLRLRPDPPRRGRLRSAARGGRGSTERDGRSACAWPLGGGPSAGGTSMTSCASFPAKHPRPGARAPKGPADEPVTMMDYLASITYRTRSRTT